MEGVAALIVVAALALIVILALLAQRKRQPQAFLEPDVWKQLPLVDKKELTHNTRRFR
jgi:hypothetical protein